MGAAVEEGEVGGDFELGVAHGETPSSEDTVQIPRGHPVLALLVKAFAEHPVAVPVLVLDAVIVAGSRSLPPPRRGRAGVGVRHNDRLRYRRPPPPPRP